MGPQSLLPEPANSAVQKLSVVAHMALHSGHLGCPGPSPSSHSLKVEMDG